MLGWVTLKTKMDNSSLDKQIKKLETRIKNQELNLDITFANQEKLESDLNKVLKKLDAIEVKKKKLATDKTDITTQLEPIQAKINNKEKISYDENILYEKLMPQLQEINKEEAKLTKEAEKYNKEVDSLNAKLEKAELSYQKQTNDLNQMNDDMEGLLDKQEQMNYEKAQKGLKSVGDKTESIIKKVAKWGLAIFGVRSAYMFIRQSMSTLSQYNEKLASDLQYIRFALASSLQGLIENIVKLVYKVLAYVNYLAKAWFGVNLFANASAKAFQKANKSVGATTKNAKELQKTLAGFDEMNILQDNGSTATGGGGGGVALPSNDLSMELEDKDAPAWLVWLKDNGGYVATILGAIAGAILAIKLTSFLGGILGVTEGLGKLSAGVGVIVGGLILLGGSIANMIINWDNMTVAQKQANIELAAIGVALVALGAVITGLISGPLGLFIGVMALIVGGIASVIVEQDKETKSTKSLKTATQELVDAKDKLRQSTNRYTSALDDAQASEKELERVQKKYHISGEELFASVLAGTKTVSNMTKEELEVYKAYLNNEGAQKELKEATDEMNESRRESIQKSIEQSAALWKEKGQYSEYFKAVLDGYKNKTVSESQMLDATANIYRRLDDNAKKTFAQNLPDYVKEAFDNGNNNRLVRVWSDGTETKFRDISNASKKTFSEDLPKDITKSVNKLESLTKSIDTLKKKGNVNISVKTTTSSSSSGGSKNAKGAIYYPPRLAVGGVINQPGRGVPLAVGGEAGAEGVIPLTDAQQMQKLGEAIGRYITINATMINQMNGRVISRELKTIQNEENFLYNR